MHPIRILLACLLSAVVTCATAQAGLKPELSDLSALPLHRAPPASIAKALGRVSSKSRPLRFAVAVPLALGLADGLWDEPEAGIARWRTRVTSRGAAGLSLEFSRLQLPQGGALWIYDDAGELVQGPYAGTAASPQNKLSTALVPGSDLVIELRVPSAARDAVQLQVARVQHAFLDITKADAYAPSKSGSCNVDVICTDGDPWRKEIRSVARITLYVGDEGFFCTGQLLNNARQDHAPLFITANHCDINTAAVASSVVFYWNYQTSSCDRASPNGSLGQNQSGATLLAGDVGTDFTLLRANATPDPAFNVYYAGWDASGATPQSGVAIHHPGGEEKRISTFTSPAAAGQVCIDEGEDCSRNIEAWRVNWSRGTTEQGSSGGGLWNQDHRLVGVLSGGNASCSDPGGDDFFARLAAGYTANSSSSGQLKAWLDPTATGVKSLPGLDNSDPDGGSGGGGDPAGESSGGGGMGLLSLLVLGLGGLVSARRACRGGSAA